MIRNVRQAIDEARQKARTDSRALRLPIEKEFLKRFNLKPESELTLTQYNKVKLDWLRAAGVENPSL